MNQSVDKCIKPLCNQKQQQTAHTGLNIGETTMNRTTYNRTRRSIRDNGLRYTTAHAMDTNNIAALMVCDCIANNMKTTDWLDTRQRWARNAIDSPATIIRLTTTTTN